MRLNSYTTLLFIVLMTLSGCGGGGGGGSIGGTETPDLNATIRPLVIIRIEFNDYNFTSDASVWAEKIFGTSEGQLNHYFNEISYGKFQFKAANETDGIADGIITVSLAEYHPDDLQNKIDRLVEATRLSDDYIDFSQYDTNHKGAISSDELQIIFLVAGGELATGLHPGIWAHSWCMEQFINNVASPTRDNVRLMSCNNSGTYSAFGERHFDFDNSGNDATIGIIAHELGHAEFSIPDLYDTDESSSGIGNFGLMGGGSWAHKEEDSYFGQTPVHMVGWSKVRSGFVTSTVIDQNITDLDINATSSITYTLYQVPTGRTGEYFLLENRAASGYDRGLFSLEGTGSYMGGLSILHVDDNLLDSCIDDNNCNNNESHKLVDVEEANDDSELDSNSIYVGHYNNLFFAENFDSFTPDTTPNSDTYMSGSSGVSITNISTASATMTLDVEIN